MPPKKKRAPSASSPCPGRGFHTWRRVGIDPDSGDVKFKCRNPECGATYLAPKDGDDGAGSKFRQHHNPPGV